MKQYGKNKHRKQYKNNVSKGGSYIMRNNLKEARRRAGMTQRDVAKYWGISESHYQKIKYGK